MFKVKNAKHHISKTMSLVLCVVQLVFSFLIKHLDNNVDVGVSVQHHPHLLLDGSHSHPGSSHLVKESIAHKLTNLPTLSDLKGRQICSSQVEYYQLQQVVFTAASFPRSRANVSLSIQPGYD